jgi:hypothetical protein
MHCFISYFTCEAATLGAFASVEGVDAFKAEPLKGVSSYGRKNGEASTEIC